MQKDPRELERIDVICDEFEKAWKAGSRPRIDDYLGAETAIIANERLLVELISLEIELRHKAGEIPLHADYSRFSSKLVEMAFGYPERIARFTLLQLIGKGTFGVVYRAIDSDSGEVCALKTLNPYWLSEKDVRDRFTRETKIAMKIEHPNVVKVIGADAMSCQPYIAMEYIDGASLREHLKSNPRPSVESILRIAVDVSRGLAAAHSQGIIHRDLKPANIMLHAGRGTAIITDFGLAHDAEQSRLSVSQDVLGTAAYMSPEQCKGRTTDVRSDLFSLGTILYEMCCGCRPFAGATDLEVRANIIKADPPPIPNHRRQIPLDLVRIVERLHHPDASRRYESVEVVADLLQSLLQSATQTSSAARSNLSTKERPATMTHSRRDAQIAIVGHTNFGKTTLLRTLTRKAVGEVGDRPGVTQRAHPERHSTLQAVFIDCPGFERAWGILYHYDKFARLPSKEELELIDHAASPKGPRRATAELELNAVIALGEADAAIYVASLERVPEGELLYELRLTVMLQPNIVAVVNKLWLKDLSKEAIANRIAQWKEAFHQAGIKHVVLLDAWRHSPSRIDELNAALLDVLSVDLKESFRAGLDAFREWRASIRGQAADAVAGFVCSIRDVGYEAERKTFEPINHAFKGADSVLKEHIAVLSKKFLESIWYIYGVACNPDCVEVSTAKTTCHDKEGALKGALSVGSIAALVGSAITVLTIGADGGLATAAGTQLAASSSSITAGLAGAIGALTGAFRGGFKRKIQGKHDSHAVGQYARWALTVVCAESRHGYGCGPELNAKIVDELDAEVGTTMTNMAPPPDWENDSKPKIAAWCTQVLKSLEGE